MASYGATDHVGIECGGVSTGCESGGASARSESGGASAGSATVGTLAVGDVVAAVDVAVPASTCWISRPQLGLVGTESVLHGGALHVPVYLNGSESSVMTAHQTILRTDTHDEPPLQHVV